MKLYAEHFSFLDILSIADKSPRAKRHVEVVCSILKQSDHVVPVDQLLYLRVWTTLTSYTFIMDKFPWFDIAHLALS